MFYMTYCLVVQDHISRPNKPSSFCMILTIFALQPCIPSQLWRNFLISTTYTAIINTNLFYWTYGHISIPNIILPIILRDFLQTYKCGINSSFTSTKVLALSRTFILKFYIHTILMQMNRNMLGGLDCLFMFMRFYIGAKHISVDETYQKWKMFYLTFYLTKICLVRYHRYFVKG